VWPALNFRSTTTPLVPGFLCKLQETAKVGGVPNNPAVSRHYFEIASQEAGTV
jgi:hypothetical protein